jgi:hypothetical protein
LCDINPVELKKHFSKRPNIISTKIQPMGAELVHADGQTEGHYEAKNRLSKLFSEITLQHIGED